MPSHLRLESSFAPIDAQATYQTSPRLQHPAKKQKMSLTQTYYVASTARSKLGREASRADHDLRLLVGHANLLDSLMIELADAEREQEAWFNQSVKKASYKPEESRHIQWIDSIAEEDDDSDMESDAGSDIDEDEDAELFNIPVRKLRSPPVMFSSEEVDEDMEEDDEYDEGLTLTRVTSKHSPPELLHDEEESESEDDLMPSSPEQPSFEFSDKDREAITTTTFYDTKQSHLEEYMAQEPQQPFIAAC